MSGQAALAMWWDVTPGMLGGLEDWHAHEHFPERLGVPGFRRASRWRRSGAAAIFMLYELDDHGVLSSPDYLSRLNKPTPWSTQMMPHHVGMIRGQCRVEASRGGVVASRMLTVRLSPQPGREAALADAIRQRIDRLPQLAGMVGLHWLRHETPAIQQTTEQQLRGGKDRVADWVLLASAYDDRALHDLANGALGQAALEADGAAAGMVAAVHELSQSGIATDAH